MTATADLHEALTGKELIVLAVPSHGLRGVVSEGLPSIDPGALLVSTAKGIEKGAVIGTFGHAVSMGLFLMVAAIHRGRKVTAGAVQRERVCIGLAV